MPDRSRIVVRASYNIDRIVQESDLSLVLNKLD